MLMDGQDLSKKVNLVFKGMRKYPDIGNGPDNHYFLSLTPWNSLFWVDRV